MKFGHYSNEELGIKRNLTCAMFDSKGAGITPPKPEAKDLQCALDNAREFVKKSLIEQAEDFFGFKASDYKDCAQKIYTSYKGGKLYDWGGGTDVDDIIRGCIGDYFGGTLRDLKKEGISASAAQKLLTEELKKFEAAVRPYAEKMQKVVLQAKAEFEKKNSKKMSNDLDELSAELEDKEMDNELDELQAGLDEDMDNDIDEAEMSEDDEEIQAGLEDEAECGLDDETEMSEDELDALCSIDDETDCENDDDEVEMSEDDEETEMDNSIDEDMSNELFSEMSEDKLDAACGLEDEDMSEDDTELQCSFNASYKNKLKQLLKQYPDIYANAKRLSVADLEKKGKELYKAYVFVMKGEYDADHCGYDDMEDFELWADVEHHVINQLTQVNSAYEKKTGARLIPSEKFPYPKSHHLPGKGSRSRGRKMSNDLDEPEDVKCSRRRGRGRNMSNEIDKAKDAACSRKRGRKMCNEIDKAQDVKCSKRRGRGRSMSNEIDKAKDAECINVFKDDSGGFTHVVRQDPLDAYIGNLIPKLGRDRGKKDPKVTYEKHRAGLKQVYERELKEAEKLKQQGWEGADNFKKVLDNRYKSKLELLKKFQSKDQRIFNKSQKK